jgi:transcriptional regulator with XRE-family HTH domain
MQKLPPYPNTLRALIKCAGYTFRAVNRETGIPESTLYDWAAGNRVIPYQDRVILARILGCTTEEFAPVNFVQRTDKQQAYEGRRREPLLDHKYKTETARVAYQRKRAEEMGLQATLCLEQWLETLEYFGWKCAYCRGKYAVIEHFVPLVHGGGTTVGFSRVGTTLLLRSPLVSSLQWM